MDNRPIGFFDSGLGGLSVVPHLLRRLPDEHVIYYGDTARTPYGSKSPETIKRFSFQIADYLVESGVKMIAIACNTVSATCVDDLRLRYPGIPVVGIIEPMAKTIAHEFSAPTDAACKAIGIIGTKVTVASGVYERMIGALNPDVRVVSRACPLFVPTIEEGVHDRALLDLMVRYYLDDFIRDNDLHSLVLGCTHYPLLAENITWLYPDVKLYDPAVSMVEEIVRLLAKSDAFAVPNEQAHRCFASDLSANFQAMIDQIFAEAGEVSMEFKKFE